MTRLLLVTAAALTVTACMNAEDADRFERAQDRADLENPDQQRSGEETRAPSDPSYRHEAPFDVDRD